MVWINVHKDPKKFCPHILVSWVILELHEGTFLSVYHLGMSPQKHKEWLTITKDLIISHSKQL
jgi:hypothetical protein